MNSTWDKSHVANYITFAVSIILFRKRHYNEMELVRKFRQEHAEELDTDGDADDEQDWFELDSTCF